MQNFNTGFGQKTHSSLLKSLLCLLLFCPFGIGMTTKAQVTIAPNLNQCEASPKAGSAPSIGNNYKGYRLKCTVSKAKNANCERKCVFSYRCKLQFFDGSNWVTTDKSLGGIHNSVYNDWHQPGDTNIQWVFDSTAAIQNNASEFGQKNLKINCEGELDITVNMSSGVPINPTPTNPSGAPEPFTLSSTVHLTCSECKEIITILDTFPPEELRKAQFDLPQEQPIATPLKVYLNFAGHYSVQFSSLQTSGPYQIQVFDLQGRSLLNTQGQLVAVGTNTLKLPTGSIPAGVYLVLLRLPNGQLESTRFIVSQSSF